VKPGFKGPAFYVFPHLRYIFCGPSQSSICLCIIFPDLTFFDLRIYPPILHMKQWFPTRVSDLILLLKGIFFHVPTHVWPPSRSWGSSSACHAMQTAQISKAGILLICGRQHGCPCQFIAHPLCQFEVITVCSFLRCVWVSFFLEAIFKYNEWPWCWKEKS
jgi:hypothetical protein